MSAPTNRLQLYGIPKLSFDIEKQDVTDYQKMNWLKLDQSFVAKSSRFDHGAQAIFFAAILFSHPGKDSFVAQNLNGYIHISFRQLQIPISIAPRTGDFRSNYVPNVSAMESTSIAKLKADFNKLADRWEKDTAIYSAPGATYLNRDYIAIIAKGLERPSTFVPLILNRLSVHGGDWFFALENITGENPAKECEDYASAVKAWTDWAEQNLPIEASDAMPTA